MRLEIQCEDRVGMVREILDLFIPDQIDMRLIEVDTKQRCLYCGFPDIPFPQLQTLLAKIRRLDSVEDVKTVMFTPFEREHHSLYTLLESLPDGVISVDLKGRVTMMTEQAAEDLQVSVADFLYQPLSQVIKGVNLSKEAWDKSHKSMNKRIRIRHKTLLLEMKPIFVCDEEGVENLAGTVIYLKSESRLVKQTACLKQVPNTENPLGGYFQPSVVKSLAMQRIVSDAETFSELSLPLFIQGEVGSGKRHFVEALFQYWHKQRAETTAQLIVRNARNITQEDIVELDKRSGWYVIEDVECLDDSVQLALTAWLNCCLDHAENAETRVRLISLSSLSQSQLANGSVLRQTLYFSLARLVLSMPSLRERREDIEGLVQQMVLTLSEQHRLNVPRVSKSAVAKLALYDWPGNVKELQDRCLQTLLVTKNTRWQAQDIVLPDSDYMPSMKLINGSLEQTIKQWEAQLLKNLYPDFPSSRRLAKAVGVSHSTIANKLKEYGLNTK